MLLFNLEMFLDRKNMMTLNNLIDLKAGERWGGGLMSLRASYLSFKYRGSFRRYSGVPLNP